MLSSGLPPSVWLKGREASFKAWGLERSAGDRPRGSLGLFGGEPWFLSSLGMCVFPDRLVTLVGLSFPIGLLAVAVLPWACG